MLELWGVYQGCNEVLECYDCQGFNSAGKVFFKLDGQYYERTLRTAKDGRRYVSIFGCKFMEA